MKTLTAFASLMAAVGVSAQTFPTAATTARSMTGQFYVTALSKTGARPSSISATNADLIRLEPTLVAVSCERIKQTVWRELEFRGSWQHKAAIVLYPARSAEDNVTIITERSMDGWSYRVALPDTLPRERYLKAIVQVVLLDLANRRASHNPAEIPVWLTEGFSFHLLCNNSPELLLDAPNYRANGLLLEPRHVEIRRLSSLERAHKILVGATPLTFEELSWPMPGQFEGSFGPKSQASAQLLVCELLKLRGGPECMRKFLAVLPDYLNWQMAFLHGFDAHFQRPLDVEKWWALETMEFAGRDLTQTWPYDESWAKLAGALVEPVDVFTSTNELPGRSEVTLQTVVREWDPDRRKQVLQRKLTQLGSLRLRIAPELLPLANAYAVSIDTYLNQIETLTTPAAGSHIAAGGGRLAQQKLLRNLDRLDAERMRLRPEAGGPPAGLVTSGTSVPSR